MNAHLLQDRTALLYPHLGPGFDSQRTHKLINCVSWIVSCKSNWIKASAKCANVLNSCLISLQVSGKSPFVPTAVCVCGLVWRGEWIAVCPSAVRSLCQDQTCHLTHAQQHGSDALTNEVRALRTQTQGAQTPTHSAGSWNTHIHVCFSIIVGVSID